MKAHGLIEAKLTSIMMMQQSQEFIMIQVGQLLTPGRTFITQLEQEHTWKHILHHMK